MAVTGHNEGTRGTASDRSACERPFLRPNAQCPAAQLSCYNFLYGFKGAPSARHAYGRNLLRELARATGGE